jgi:protein arginine kinase
MSGGDAHESNGAQQVLQRMAAKPASWLSGDGSWPGIVLSSRVRLARNLAGFPFGNRASDEEKRAIVGDVTEAAAAAPSLSGGAYLDMAALSDLDRQLLYERHLISRDLAGEGGDRGVFVSPDETVSVLVNEEDHLRIQGVASGYELEAAWHAADRLDTELALGVSYAFSSEWGYLTACPTNVGTGMRASVLIHLPALVLTKQIGKVLQGIAQVGLAVRGLHGEGTDVMGNFFQVSNQMTLGRSELDILESLTRVTQQLIEHERAAAAVLLRDARVEIEDKVHRARGILSSCRVISADEVMSLASALRLGIQFGLLDSMTIRELNRMLILSQSAHLQRAKGALSAASLLDQARADLVRAVVSHSEN